MILLVDGKEVVVLNDVKVIYDDDYPELHITLTHEGMVQDVIQEGEVLNTTSITSEELLDQLCS